MKSVLLSSAFVLATATSVFANQWEQRAYVEDHYTTQNTATTTYEQVCQNVTVNTNRNSAGEGALLGMIIGGALGDALSHGDGDRTAAGAVIGGVIGANRSNNNQPTTRTETRCENVPVQTYTPRSIYTHSTIRFYHNGRWQTLRFQK